MQKVYSISLPPVDEAGVEMLEYCGACKIDRCAQVPGFDAGKVQVTRHSDLGAVQVKVEDLAASCVVSCRDLINGVPKYAHADQRCMLMKAHSLRAASDKDCCRTSTFTFC